MIRLVAPSSTDYHGYRPWADLAGARGQCPKERVSMDLLELKQGVR